MKSLDRRIQTFVGMEFSAQQGALGEERREELVGVGNPVVPDDGPVSTHGSTTALSRDLIFGSVSLTSALSMT